MTYNWNQLKAGGKHVASFTAGVVAAAATFHFISASQVTDINGNLNSIFSGIEQIATGVAGLIAILTPIYTGLRAAHNASPLMQGASLVVAANSADPVQAKAANTAIAAAVIESKELKLNGTIAAPAEVAAAVPSQKVVPK